MQGWVLVLRGEVETGVRQAEGALETLRSPPSARFHLPIRIGIVGLAKAAAGDIDGALALFESALEAASTTGERWYEPELFRLRAEMLLAQPKQRASEAEQCLQAAIAQTAGLRPRPTRNHSRYCQFASVFRRLTFFIHVVI